MRSKEEITDRIASCTASVALQKKLRDTIPEKTRDYYLVNDMINNFLREIQHLKWVLDDNN